MECCLFIGFIIFVIIASSSNKKTNNNNSNNPNINLDEIFDTITNNDINSNYPNEIDFANNRSQNRARNKNRPLSKLVESEIRTNNNMVKSTNHVEHDCEEVNYDNISSLEGESGSFNLGEPEPTIVYQEKPQIQITREDLLKSFIMSEVLQKYDINRIYNRIPTIKSDD